MHFLVGEAASSSDGHPADEHWDARGKIAFVLKISSYLLVTVAQMERLLAHRTTLLVFSSPFFLIEHFIDGIFY